MASSVEFTNLKNLVEKNISEQELRRMAELAIRSGALYDYAPTKDKVFLKETKVSEWVAVQWAPSPA